MEKEFEIAPVTVTGKTVICGWCKARGVPYRSDGDLQQHVIPTSSSTVCKGYESWMKMDAQTLKIKSNG